MWINKIPLSVYKELIFSLLVMASFVSLKKSYSVNHKTWEPLNYEKKSILKHFLGMIGAFIILVTVKDHS